MCLLCSLLCLFFFFFFLFIFFFFFKQKTTYEIEYGLVGSEMCIRDRQCVVRPDVVVAAAIARDVAAHSGSSRGAPARPSVAVPA